MNLPVLKDRSRFGWLPSVFKDDTFDGFMDGFFRDFNNMFYNDDCCKVEDDNVIYTLDVPGFNKDNLNVEVSEGVLTISGESEVRKENFHGRSKILKRFTVGEVEKASAVIKDGILTVKLEYPKKEINVKKIEISDGKCECKEEDCGCVI